MIPTHNPPHVSQDLQKAPRHHRKRKRMITPRAPSKRPDRGSSEQNKAQPKEREEDGVCDKRDAVVVKAGVDIADFGGAVPSPVFEFLPSQVLVLA